MLTAIALILHLIAINIWVGGTFFTVVILGRAIRTVEATQRQLMWQLVLRRFFAWTWLAVVVLLCSGIWMVYSLYGGFASVPAYVVLMGLLALLMAANFFFIFFMPYAQFRQAITRGDIDGSLRRLQIIRYLSIINIVLGLCIVVVIGSGPHLL